MARVTKYGKVFSVRLTKEIEADLLSYCMKNQINEADLIRIAIEGYLKRKEQRK